MAITIKDLAREAGVSHTTVSRALHGHPGIAQSTVARINDLAHSMGYVPSATARGLKNRRTRALGVIVSNIEDPFWGEVMQGVDDTLHPAGYSLFVASTHRDRQREREVVQEMIQRGVDGVILLAPQFSAEQSHVMTSYGLPIAMVNNQGAGETPYLIYNDDLFGIRLITRHLIDLGHTRVAYLGNRIGGSTNDARLAGFLGEMHAAGLSVPPELIYMVPSSTPEGGEQGGRYLLGLPALPEAVVCYNDYLAVGLYRAFQNAGVRIPQDVSVTGFDDITISAYLSPPLTTLHQDKYALGAGAARMLLDNLDIHQPAGIRIQEPRRVSLQGALVVRASTRRV